MSRPASSSRLDALRDRIRRIEAPARHGVLPLGVAAIDALLPGGGLALGAVHEIAGADGDEEDGAAAAGFIAGILARLNPDPMSTSPSHRCAMGPSLFPLKGGEGKRGRRKNSLSAPGGGEGRGEVGDSGALAGPVLWCLKRPDLYGPGLMAHGFDPGRLVLVAARRDDDILWAVEEGLRAGPASGLVAVIGEAGRLPMVAGRRLQLAAERSGVTAFLLRRWRNAAEAVAERERPSAALTRWRVGALPSIDIAHAPGIGRPCWRIELLRCRGGVAGSWDVEVADATGHVSLSAELADRPAMPAEQNTAWRRTEPLVRRAG